MLLRDLMWEVFQSTGQIEAYLIYRSCTEANVIPETPPVTKIGL
ncbi:MULTISPECIES: YqzL family protein [Pelosinus]|nr:MULTISPECIES: YqzL family protein [Pelosinus]